MTSRTVYLISGANRGIGLELTRVLSARPNAVIYAGARDPSSATELQALANANEVAGAVKVVRLISGDEEGNEKVLDEIGREEGKLDVVIANAGIAKYFGTFLDTPIQEWKEHFDVNVLGPVVLFKKAYPLLRASDQKIFAVISSSVGSIGEAFPFSASAYGASKAAVNHATVQIHLDHAKEGICAFAIHPGWVATDNGNLAARNNGLDVAPSSVEDSVRAFLQHIDGATVETKGGRFWSFAGPDNQVVW